jgi:soluble lytic murein transglycosylase
MSSVWRAVLLVPVLLALAPSSSAQYAAPTSYSAAASMPSVAYSLDEWRRLRARSDYSFAEYASFLIANPDWPDAQRMRGWAERRCGREKIRRQ